MILQALVRLYERRAADGDVPLYGFSEEGISFAILLDPEGYPAGTQSLQDTSGKRPRPSRRLVPRRVERTVNVEPNFLWDNTGYVLGVKSDRSGNMVRVRRGEHEAFKQFHAELLEEQDDEGLRAVRRFLERWQPEEYERLGRPDEMLGANVTFMLDRAEGLVADREAARAVWEEHLSKNQAEPGPCLVTGSRNAPMAGLHPPVGGFVGALSTRAKLVSFNEPAFESHGNAQGSNAPVSELAAFKYGAALNALLAPGSRRRIGIGKTTVVFWAEAASRSAAKAAEDVCYSVFGEPPADDEEEAAQVRKVLEVVAHGRPLREASPECEDGTRFYVLGLEPNRTRLAVRFWYETTIGDLARRMGEHWRDMRLEPEPWLTPPAAWRLLLETAPKRPGQRPEPEKVQPSLIAPLTRAIFTGTAYPQSLLLAVIARLRADGNLSGVRAAILKACIRRAERMSQREKEDNLVSLNTTSDNVPYLLGRLFAVFMYAEKAVAERSATISDKWFGSASSAPSRAFPSLMRGFRHNISKLGKGDSKSQGSGVRAEKAAEEIARVLPAPGDLPSFMVPEDQARFFVGYYHQKGALYTKTPAVETGKEKNE